MNELMRPVSESGKDSLDSAIIYEHTRSHSHMGWKGPQLRYKPDEVSAGRKASAGHLLLKDQQIPI